MSWWIWILLGLALLVVELVTPGGLFALFFGVAALCVAALALVGLGGTAQWLDSLVGEQVVLLGDLPAGGETKAELRGSPWNARAVSGIPLSTGQRCRVERIDGLTLWVRAE